MKRSSHKLFTAAGALLMAPVLLLNAAEATLTVQTDQPGVAINHGMWGIFFEDINLGADGGLYAELVKNRSFEFPDALMGWTIASSGVKTGNISVVSDTPFNKANPHYLRIDAGDAQEFGVSNEGFRGIGVKDDEKYDFSAQIRVTSGSPILVVRLVDSAGKILAEEKIKKLSADWSLRKVTLRPEATVQKAALNILVVGGGVVDLDMVSLFPRDTWKHRPGGLRADMVQLLADLKPGFMRFPGGCIVEGHTLTNRYQWKTTIGPIEERKLIMNRWNDEFKHRPTPDYYQSFGLGFFEYFQLCEDIGASPLPILNCGMACQYNSGELCPLDELGPYIQDALDLIEFANGPTNSVWGAKRAAFGHPAPFNLKMIGVGNEQWDQQYIERYAKFHAALKAQHPEIKLVSAAGPGPDGKRFDFAWKNLRELHADIVDEHCYAKPDWFYNNRHRYDSYDRNGPKVFFGEYAAQSDKTVSINNRNNLDCALSEAACMTGLERNGDVVQMASYAPLFAHVDGWQWKPDLIWVNNLQSYGTPNYYVQKLFANNPGDVTVPLKLDAPSGAKLFASATRDKASGELILKVVNGGSSPADVKLDLAGVKKVASKAAVSTLTSGSVQDENSFTEPKKVFPKESKLKISAPQFSYTFPANSLTVLRLKITK
ncbi:MAG TPA: alpha-L-arabinofuranosidase C-terminal domain-containing protein [bacterium]|nr:alpha-L-arabinofuranosidase C-terminal domain-containing protein [bacterium]